MAERNPSPEEEPATTPMRSVTDIGPRLLGSRSFFKLWLAQVISSLGDWIGLVAILSITARVGGKSPEAAIALVMSARMIPGFFLASVGGVLVDRWDRKKVMVACDVGRGLVLASLPLVQTVPGLFVASLILEILTLLWSPAKEASVPNMVPTDKLATANSFSLAAAYGTFPLGSALFASLTQVSEWVGEHAGPLAFLRLSQESLAIYVDVLTFFGSALLLSTLAIPRNSVSRNRPISLQGRRFWSSALTEAKEGWQFISANPLVRSVMIGLGTGLIGGGMVAPLGPTYSNDVLGSGPAGFGLLLTALGTGLAIGVVGVSTIQQRLAHQRIFPLAVLGAGASMMVAVSMSSLALTMAFIALMGVCAGAVYVLGFTILQENVSDDLRGRIFAALYTLSRLCLLISLSLAPLLASILDRIRITPVPGVRVTLWLGASVIVVAGILAIRTLRTSGEEMAT